MSQIDYEALPYSSMPFPLSQPAHLAALAMLHGCAAPPVATARVLELGCASGGNLIPLAARYPDAVFEGVDLSERHVREGAALIAELGLTNMSIRQGDIGALDLSGQTYDYIICHGVFSWAPRAVQEAIFRICREHLTDSGIAYVSYNVLPGWHFRLIVRDICRFHTDPDAAPQIQIAHARQMLDEVAHLSDEASAFGKVLREEVLRSKQMNDTHFQGEFLGAYNDPCHFHEFMAAAHAHGLSYLCDAGLTDGMPESLGAERGEAARRLAGDGPLALEQYIDFVTGRPFRRSLLVRGPQPAERALSPAALAHLHYSCPLSPEDSPEAGKGGAFVLRKDKARLATNDPVVGSALMYLASAYPDTRSFQEILTHVAGATGLRLSQVGARISDALVRTVRAGHVTASARPLRVGSADAERPALWSVARAQLRQGQAWVSNQLHTPVQISPGVRLVAALLDGANTRAQIQQRISDAIAARELVVDGATGLASRAAQHELAGQLLQSAMMEFRRNALLAAPP